MYRVIGFRFQLTHKLARLVYFMLTKGQAYVEAGQQYYEERYSERVVQNLTKRANQLGLQITPATPPMT